jgi:hypothetical protein
LWRRRQELIPRLLLAPVLTSLLPYGSEATSIYHCTIAVLNNHFEGVQKIVLSLLLYLLRFDVK